MGHPRWWQATLGPSTPHPSNVKLTCAASLGSPSNANCEAALFQFMRSGHVTLGPKHPLIRTAGTCAIGVSSTTKQTTSWDVLRSVAESLLASCISHPAPFSGRMGGFARSTPVVGRRRGRRQQEDDNEESFPVDFTLSVYLQLPFEGQASETCAWDVASSHTGDVRKCPAMTEPWRPPERRLGQIEVKKQGNITEVIKGNVTYLTAGNDTQTVDANLTDILSEFPPFASSTTAWPETVTAVAR